MAETASVGNFAISPGSLRHRLGLQNLPSLALVSHTESHAFVFQDNSWVEAAIGLDSADVLDLRHLKILQSDFLSYRRLEEGTIEYGLALNPSDSESGEEDTIDIKLPPGLINGGSRPGVRARQSTPRDPRKHEKRSLMLLKALGEDEEEQGEEAVEQEAAAEEAAYEDNNQVQGNSEGDESQATEWGRMDGERLEQLWEIKWRAGQEQASKRILLFTSAKGGKALDGKLRHWSSSG